MPAQIRGIGLAGGDVDVLADRLLGAWDAFLAIAESTDLARPSRLPGWTCSDVCVHLGSWPEQRPLEGVLESARAGGTGQVGDAADWNERVVAAHRGASREQVLAALVRSRDTVEAFLTGPEAGTLGRAMSASAVGPMPVLALANAGAYELAVHALDLRVPVPAGLLDAGLAALIDVTGGLAARHGVVLEVTAQTPHGGWRFDARAEGWDTTPVPAGPVRGTAVLGEAALLLDLSAGRAHVPAALASGRLHVQEMASFLRLAPLVHQVPGLPGGAALRRAVSGVTALTRVAGLLRRR